MARIRTLKPEIWEDEALGGCSLEARLLYVGLITQADDAGRFRARGALLRARVFPYDDGESGRPRISGQTVSLWLNELAVAHLVALYEIEGEVYGCFDGDSWQRHQKIDRPSPSKIPAPRESQSALFPVTPGALGEASSSPRRVFVEPSTTDQEGIRKGSGRDLDQKERECAREAAPTVADYFAVLVELYPRQPIEDELAVQRELFATEKLLPSLEQFRSNLAAWASCDRWTEKGGRYVPKPARWIHDGGYRNPPPANAGGSGAAISAFRRPGSAVSPSLEDPHVQRVALD